MDSKKFYEKTQKDFLKSVEEKKILTMPKDYQNKINKFYENKGKEKVENFLKEIKEKYNESICLYWDEKKGLTNIIFHIDSGADLDQFNEEFVWANLGSKKTKEPILEIIKKYKSLLNKIKTQKKLYKIN